MDGDNGTVLHKPIDLCILDILPDAQFGWSVETLLRRLVIVECATYEERQKERRCVVSISLADLISRLAKGRAGVAELPAAGRVAAEAAIDAVLTAFTDGLILLFIDGRRCADLQEKLQITPETRMMLAHRVMLRG